MPVEIILPYKFVPRSYQIPVLAALDMGCKRAVTVWHRRSGKDITAMNYAIRCMFPHPLNPIARIGTYYHVFPTYGQGKRAIWDGRTDPDEQGQSMAFLDFFHPDLFPLKRRSETEMRIECINGSAYQIIGAENLDAIVGTNQVGCIFSEYSLQDPMAWKLISPILMQNNGWAWFIYTPRGRNHGWDLWHLTEGDPKWFRQLLTIDHTKREDGTPVITKEKYEETIRQGIEEEFARQEYYCSFNIGVAGSYYANLLSQAENEHRISRGLYDPLLQVDTWWDIGIDDATAIWFTQQLGKEIRIIDYYEAQGEGLPYYAAMLAEKRMHRNYIYGSFNFPHDMMQRELSTGRTRIEQARKMGLNPARCVTRMAKEDVRAAVRAVLPRCWFDAEHCRDGIEALRNFHKTYDEKRKVYMNEPVHDWASHAADAFGVLAVGIKEMLDIPRPDKAETEFDVFEYDKLKSYSHQQETAETEYRVFGG